MLGLTHVDAVRDAEKRKSATNPAAGGNKEMRQISKFYKYTRIKTPLCDVPYDDDELSIC